MCNLNADRVTSRLSKKNLPPAAGSYSALNVATFPFSPVISCKCGTAFCNFALSVSGPTNTFVSGPERVSTGRLKAR